MWLLTLDPWLRSQDACYGFYEPSEIGFKFLLLLLPAAEEIIDINRIYKVLFGHMTT